MTLEEQAEDQVTEAIAIKQFLDNEIKNKIKLLNQIQQDLCSAQTQLKFVNRRIASGR